MIPSTVCNYGNMVADRALAHSAHSDMTMVMLSWTGKRGPTTPRPGGVGILTDQSALFLHRKQPELAIGHKAGHESHWGWLVDGRLPIASHANACACSLHTLSNTTGHRHVWHQEDKQHVGQTCGCV